MFSFPLLGNRGSTAAPPSSRTKPDDDRKDAASKTYILPRVAMSTALVSPTAATPRDRRRSSSSTSTSSSSAVHAAALFCFALSLAVLAFVVTAALNSATSETRGGVFFGATTAARAESSAGRATKTAALSFFSPLPLTSSSTSSASSQRQHQQRFLPRRRPSPPPTDASVVAASLSLANSNSVRPDSEFPPAVPRAPLLSTAELLTLQHYARGSSYVEWGSGASTALAAPMARRAVSIENQRSWCDEMQASPDVDFWIKDGVLTFLCVDTGPTGELGMPRPEANPEHFRRYLSALDDAADTVLAQEEKEMEEMDVEAEKEEMESKMEVEAEAEAEAKAAASSFSSSMARFLGAKEPKDEEEGRGGKALFKDFVSTTTTSGSPSARTTVNPSARTSVNPSARTTVNPSARTTATATSTTTKTTSSTNAFTVVLVDGRFRVACALKALWHIDHSRGVLLVHDWTLRKEQYHAPILKRYRLVTVIDRLAVLVPSSPQAQEGLALGNKEQGDQEEQEAARIRWWSEAAAELDRYSRDPA